MSIEALRVLEKEIRDDAHEWRHTSGATGIASTLEGWADRLESLLTTRQEVAPVAWEYRYQYANGEWSDWIRKSEEYVERTKVHLSMEGITCETRALYTATGQTSDARDGE